MKIIVSQQDKKLTAEFYHDKVIYKCAFAKAEDFLACIDKFLKKRHNSKTSWKSVELEFHNSGILTERVIRAIMLGLCF